jgi:hypothetical protein
MSTIDESVEKTLSAASSDPARPPRVSRSYQADEHGHLIPPSEAERLADLQAYLLARAESANLPDDPPGSDEEFWRAIDAGRPERPLFQDLYKS